MTPLEKMEKLKKITEKRNDLVARLSIQEEALDSVLSIAGGVAPPYHSEAQIILELHILDRSGFVAHTTPITQKLITKLQKVLDHHTRWLQGEEENPLPHLNNEEPNHEKIPTDYFGNR